MKRLLLLAALALILTACRTVAGYEITMNGQTIFLSKAEHGRCDVTTGDLNTTFVHCYHSGYTAAVDTFQVIYEE